ncbi:hypothetical protein N7495_003691 [Penicillium taxi]|uniref:uncharacterized protein n=1 Tax=Penicillium taxi TaxID=168475 RepID=UPI002544E2A8|nr:uncharacterized protein N7495_003691 [Penicillium taxi]KAJ5898947.1 hypothetical protein N7495_003691 [Penicillium taxi]
MFASRSVGRQAFNLTRWSQIRCVSTLKSNPHIYVHASESSPGSHILSLLPSEPVNPSLAIGVTTKLPPTTESLTENPKFLSTLQSVFSKHAHEDPDAKSQAHVMASTSGTVFLNSQQGKRRGGSDGASGQGGAGSAGRGGWIHISDTRRPPEYGRIAWPEDIFGSLEVDANGQFVGGNGNYQPSGTYRIVTRDGILGLTPYLKEKILQRLQEIEKE